MTIDIFEYIESEDNNYNIQEEDWKFLVENVDADVAKDAVEFVINALRSDCYVRVWYAKGTRDNWNHVSDFDKEKLRIAKRRSDLHLAPIVGLPV